MDISTIQVARRSERGRNQLRRLREQGRVPANLYGEGGETISLSLDEHEFVQHVRHHHKVFVLKFDDQEQSIFLQDVQWDVLTDRPLHIDFLRIDLQKELHATVEVNYLGHPKGLSKGGRLIHDVNELKVRCLPNALPELLEIQVGELDIGDEITADKLALPEGVRLDVPADTVLCHVIGATAEELPCRSTKEIEVDEKSGTSMLSRLG